MSSVDRISTTKIDVVIVQPRSIYVVLMRSCLYGCLDSSIDFANTMILLVSYARRNEIAKMGAVYILLKWIICQIS
jgi:hypothetical protein